MLDPGAASVLDVNGSHQDGGGPAVCSAGATPSCFPRSCHHRRQGRGSRCGAGEVRAARAGHRGEPGRLPGRHAGGHGRHRVCPGREGSGRKSESYGPGPRGSWHDEQETTAHHGGRDQRPPGQAQAPPRPRWSWHQITCPRAHVRTWTRGRASRCGRSGSRSPTSRSNAHPAVFRELRKMAMNDGVKPQDLYGRAWGRCSGGRGLDFDSRTGGEEV